MKAALITYLFLLTAFLQTHPARSTATQNPRFARMLRGKQPSPPPPRSGELKHQDRPQPPEKPDPDTPPPPPPQRPPPSTAVLVRPPPPPPAGY
ncbi:hypothetical protein ABFS82_06G070700 [Erythranthe guttata]